MASVGKYKQKWRVRIRLRGHPLVSKVFRYKTDTRRWGEKAERAMQLGLLSPDQDCTLKALLLRYGRDITVTNLSTSLEIRCALQGSNLLPTV